MPNKFENIIRPYIEQGAAVGTAVAIIQNGQLTYAGGFGTTTVEESGIQITPDTLFAYGSISKTFCAILVMRLVEAGLLDLNTSISNYLPDLAFSNAGYGRAITLQNILSHTTGLPMAGKYWGPRYPESLGESIYEQVSRYQFLSAPGDLYLYANTVYCTAGHIAEAVTGKFYDELVQEYIFDPLKMGKVTFDPAVVMTYPLAQAHLENEDGSLVEHQMPYNVSGNPSSFAYGSVMDLVNFAQMILAQGAFEGQQFLLPESIQATQQALGISFIDGAAHPFSQMNRAYGLGFQVGHYKGHPSVRHGGMNLSNNCFFDLFPEQKTAVIALTNYCNDPVLMEMICALYDEVLGIDEKGIIYQPKPERVPMPSIALGACCGTFLCVEMGQLLELSVRNGELVAETNGNEYPLVPIGNGRFYIEITKTYRQMIKFEFKSADDLDYAMIGGMPFHPWEIETDIDVSGWSAWAGVYQDPTNKNPNEMMVVTIENGEFAISEDGECSIGQAISSRAFLTHVGLVEANKTQEGQAFLTIGKATRYFKK
ncbi:MAG: serine hydrolase domain-containing protein [Chloroflexota bacterium]